MNKDSIEYLNIYINVTEKVKQQIEKHVKRYKLTGEICAWYADWDDFCSDWCNENIGYTKTKARKLLHGGKGEFMYLPDNLGIIRFVM